MMILKRLFGKFDQIIRVSNLAPTPFDRAYVLFAGLLLAMRHRIPVRWRSAPRLTLVYEGTRFSFRAYYSTDFAVLEEIFLDEEYRINEQITPSVIVDLGSNTGVSVRFFRIRYPQARVYAFEADPVVFENLKKNFEADEPVQAFNLAIADHDGPVTFFVHPKSNIASSLERRSRAQVPIRVEGKTLDSALDAAGIGIVDLLKFDIEGGEAKMAAGFDSGRIREAIGELHTDLTGLSPEAFARFFPRHEVTTHPISVSRSIIRVRPRPKGPTLRQ